MGNAQAQPSKESYQLVQFGHAGITKEYTDWTSDVPFGGKTYLSIPDMEVKLPKNDGLFGDQTCNIGLPVIPGDLFTSRISAGSPHAPVSVLIREVTRATKPGAAKVVDTTFNGNIEIVKRNHRGRADKILVQCLSVKSHLDDISMGLPCYHLCDNNLGDAACKVDMADDNRQVNVNITAIDGRKMTVATNATIEAKPDRFFHRGFARIAGLNITIREWRDTAPLDFFLTKQPPAHWVGLAVTVNAGCDHSIETCRARFLPPGGAPGGTTGNEGNFSGYGAAMPAHHPAFEDAP